MTAQELRGRLLRRRWCRSSLKARDDGARLGQSGGIDLALVEIAIRLVGVEQFGQDRTDDGVRLDLPEGAKLLGLGCTVLLIWAVVDVALVALEERVEGRVREVEDVAATHAKHLLDVALLNIGETAHERVPGVSLGG